MTETASFGGTESLLKEHRRGRVCSVCRCWRPLTNFVPNAKDGKANGYRYTCIDCAPERSRAKKYGIKPRKLADLLASQGGRCAICGDQPPDGKRLAVDHDHKTGEVRRAPV